MGTDTDIDMNDPNWPSEEGWRKMERQFKHADGSKTTVHYNYNEVTQAVDDVKIIDR